VSRGAEDGTGGSGLLWRGMGPNGDPWAATFNDYGDLRSKEMWYATKFPRKCLQDGTGRFFSMEWWNRDTRVADAK